MARLPARDVQAASRLAARGNYQAFACAYGAVGKPHALHTARQLGRSSGDRKERRPASRVSSYHRNSARCSRRTIQATR